MMAWLLHRVSGLALSGYLLLHLWDLPPRSKVPVLLIRRW